MDPKTETQNLHRGCQTHFNNRYVLGIVVVTMVTVGGGAILDRSVFSDVVFANVCTKEGYISQEGKERDRE